MMQNVPSSFEIPSSTKSTQASQLRTCSVSLRPVSLKNTDLTVTQPSRPQLGQVRPVWIGTAWQGTGRNWHIVAP